MDEEEVIGFKALYESMKKCQIGVLWKDSVAHFALNALEEIKKLSEDLANDTYQPRRPKHFTIFHPKKREISSIGFRDRVYQRSLNDNVLYPEMTRSFIFDNWACQKGKGTDAARNRLKDFLHSYYRKYGNDGSVSQYDIHGYYPNMDHEYIENLFEKRLEPCYFEKVRENLHHQYCGDKGYNPGSQMIQIAGVSALDELDHFIKEQLHIHYYIRYMDDFLLIHNDPEYLKECDVLIKEHLAARKFEVNESKTRIYPLKCGIEFLGFNFKLTDTGKVLMLLSPKNVKAERKKLYRLVRKALNGDIPRESVDESYRSWRDHASKGNNYNLLYRMDKYYKDLWEDKDV